MYAVSIITFQSAERMNYHSVSWNIKDVYVIYIGPILENITYFITSWYLFHCQINLDLWRLDTTEEKLSLRFVGSKLWSKSLHGMTAPDNV